MSGVLTVSGVCEWCLGSDWSGSGLLAVSGVCEWCFDSEWSLRVVSWQ